MGASETPFGVQAPYHLNRWAWPQRMFDILYVALFAYILCQDFPSNQVVLSRNGISACSLNKMFFNSFFLFFYCTVRNTNTAWYGSIIDISQYNQSRPVQSSIFYGTFWRSTGIGLMVGTTRYFLRYVLEEYRYQFNSRYSIFPRYSPHRYSIEFLLRPHTC